MSIGPGAKTSRPRPIVSLSFTPESTTMGSEEIEESGGRTQPPTPGEQGHVGGEVLGLAERVDELVAQLSQIKYGWTPCCFCGRRATSFAALRSSPELWGRVGGAATDAWRLISAAACDGCKPRIQTTSRMEFELLAELDRRSRIEEGR